MRVGVTSMSADWAIPPVDLARACEERGFESLWFPEHSHIPASRLTPWPGGPDQPLPPEYWHMQDAFVAMAMAAAVTERLLVGTSVLLIGQRDPIWTAKQVASLDHLSGGRVVLGVGFGWNQEEAEHHGVDWGHRRQVVREKVEAMRALWTRDEASYEGRYVRFGPSWANPKPVQPGGPKVYLGGGTGPVLFRHIAEWGDGWMPISAKRSLAAPVADLRAAAEAAGRDPSTLDVSVFGARVDAEVLANLAAEGITRAVLTLPTAGADVVLPLLDEWAALAAPFLAASA